jgi:opacity protein-like surface antigen
MRYTNPFLIAALITVGSGARAHEAETEIPRTVAHQYMQAWLGTTDADDSWSLNDSALGSELRGDYSNLPLGGGVGQQLWGERAQYGFEGGGLVSWKNDDVEFSGGDPGLLIGIDGEFFMMDVFMGGVVAVRPTRWLRLYAAAGPSIAWGYLSGGDDDDGDDETLIVNGPNGFLVIELDESSSDFSVTVYARAGLEIELSSGFTFGLSARYVDHEFDFDERGELALDEAQFFLTLGGKL